MCLYFSVRIQYFDWSVRKTINGNKVQSVLVTAFFNTLSSSYIIFLHFYTARLLCVVVYKKNIRSDGKLFLFFPDASWINTVNLWHYYWILYTHIIHAATYHAYYIEYEMCIIWLSYL